MRSFLLKLHWFLVSQLGIDLNRLIKSFYGIPYFVKTFILFKKRYTGPLSILPCLHDRNDSAGSVSNEYFWQDLMVSQWVYSENPTIHIDIASRLDGFVAHVAAFRKIQVFDIRDIDLDIPNVVFKQADLMSAKSIESYIEVNGQCDSLSCLHAIEHFGLGRYGDDIDPFGYEKGISNMSKLLKTDGILYLSTPIGFEHVQFNANWVFSPYTIIKCSINNGLQLQKMIVFNGGVAKEINLNDLKGEKALAFTKQDLGVFVFIKK